MEEVEAAGLVMLDEDIDEEELGDVGALCEMLRCRVMGDGGRTTKGGGWEISPRFDRNILTAVRS